MATQIKRLGLFCLVALLDATYVSSTSALNLGGSGGGRKLLYRFKGNRFESKATAAREVLDIRVEYGPPGSNPPYHEDPPSPFTMTSLGKEKSERRVFDIQIDYVPVDANPNYPPPNIASASAKTFDHSASPQLKPSAVLDDLDYSPLYPVASPDETCSAEMDCSLDLDYPPLYPDASPDEACSAEEGCSPPS